MDARRTILQSSTLNPVRRLPLRSRLRKVWTFHSSYLATPYRNKINPANNHREYIWAVKSDEPTGLHVYAHILVKLTTHTKGRVELSTHISTKPPTWKYRTCDCCQRKHVHAECMAEFVVFLCNWSTLTWLLVRLNAVCSDAPLACDTGFVDVMAKNELKRKSRQTE